MKYLEYPHTVLVNIEEAHIHNISKTVFSVQGVPNNDSISSWVLRKFRGSLSYGYMYCLPDERQRSMWCVEDNVTGDHHHGHTDQSLLVPHRVVHHPHHPQHGQAHYCHW